MKRYFIYNIEYRKSDASSAELGVKIPEIITIVFCPNKSIEDDSLKREMHSFLSENNPPNKIIIIGGKYSLSDLNRIKKEKTSVLNSNSSLKGMRPEEILVLYFNEEGILFECSEQNNSAFSEFQLLDQIKEQGLLDIFIRRNGILDTESSYHFILPSGKHSNMFIRTGNLLFNGSEISFIAFCLLKFYKSNIQFIYCDTASIHPIIYALVDLRKHFDESILSPFIDSFCSYEGLNKGYAFNSSDSLVIVSATTSGRLKQEIIKKSKLSFDKIITLFVLNKNKSEDSNILLDLNPHANRFSINFSKQQNSLTEADCEFCKDGSLPVRIVGDQFLPAKLKIKDVLIETKDLPNWFKDYINQFHSKQILKCYYGEDGKTRSIYMDLNEIHKNINIEDILKPLQTAEEYKKAYFKNIESHIPASLSKILILNDDSSRLIANQIKKYFNDVLSNKKEITISEIGQFDESELLTSA